MIVSVLDKNNQPVMSLQPDDFLMREEQAVREVLRVSQHPTGRQIALLVDTSAYAEDAVHDFRLGLNALIETLHQRNKISLISYGGPSRILVEATGSRSRLEAATAPGHRPVTADARVSQRCGHRVAERHGDRWRRTLRHESHAAGLRRL